MLSQLKLLKPKFTPPLLTSIRCASSKSSHAWLQRQHKDPFVKQSKQLGYRSRAAFKLVEIDNKYKFLKNANCVVELGSAPGSWTQVIFERMKKGKVICVDLETTHFDQSDIKPGIEFKFIQGDFMNDDVMDNVYEEVVRGIQSDARITDVVLSDMAPKTSGIKDLDSGRSVDLAKAAFEFAFQVLKKDGYFVCKVFEGRDEPDFRKLLKKYFKSVHIVKPQSSRKESPEIYLVGEKFKNI